MIVFAFPCCSSGESWGNPGQAGTTRTGELFLPKNVDSTGGMLHNLPSLKLSSHLKMDGWNTSFLLGWPIFRGYVSFRESTHAEPCMPPP